MKKSIVQNTGSDDSAPAPESKEAAQLAGIPSSTEVESRSNAEKLLASGGDITGGEHVRPSIPRLNIVQKVGPLADKFAKGLFVLNQEEPITDQPGEVLEVTVIKARYYYQEIVPYGEDRIPATADSPAEVTAHGGELLWDKDENGKTIRPTWEQVVDLFLAIKCPESRKGSPTFPYEFTSEEEDASTGCYTFAVMKLKGASFTSAGKEIITAKTFYLRDGLDSGCFKFTAPLTQFRTGNSSYVATLRKGHKHSQAFREWLADYRP